MDIVNFIFPARFGLPVNFLSVVMKPHRKAQKKLHDILKDQYGYLDSKFVATEADVSKQLVKVHVVGKNFMNNSNFLVKPDCKWIRSFSRVV